MAAILRAYGKDFDVDAFLKDCSLPVCAVKYRGQPRRPKTQPDGPRHDRSGINVVASDAGFDELPKQIEDVIAFLQTNAEEVRRLCDFPGVEKPVDLDFGIAWRDTFTHSDYLPPELLRLVGVVGIGIQISHYPISDATSEA